MSAAAAGLVGGVCGGRRLQSSMLQDEKKMESPRGDKGNMLKVSSMNSVEFASMTKLDTRGRTKKVTQWRGMLRRSRAPSPRQRRLVRVNSAAVQSAERRNYLGMLKPGRT